MTTIGDASDLRAQTLAAYGALVLGALAMGLSPILVRVAEVGPFASAFWRVAAAMPALWAWDRIESAQGARAGLKPGGWTLPVLFAGVLFAGDLFFWHLSILNTTVANATFFATTAPVWVVLGSALIFREKVLPATLAGLALALAGGATLIWESLDVNPERLTGDLYGVVTAIFFGGYFLAVGRARRTHGGARLTLLSSLVSVAILGAVALALEDRMLPATPSGYAAIAALGLVSHAGGQGLLAYALGALPTTFSALVIFLEAIAAAAFGWALLGEHVTAVQVAGGCVILVGIWVARPRAVSLEPRP
jgi:drug/metabolite transporter (DMT)-like permease